MAPTVKQTVKPKLVIRGAVSKSDRVLKRKRLHFIVRKITQGPLCEAGHESDNFEKCQAKAEQNHEKLEETMIAAESESQCLEDSSNVAGFQLKSESSDHGITDEPTAVFDCRVVTKKLDRVPERMSQLSLWGLSELVVPVKYNSKMARTFEAVNRTPEEQNRRAQNTIAARESRAKIRLMCDILEKAATKERNVNFGMKQRLAAHFVYATILLEELNMPVVNFFDLWQNEQNEPEMDGAVINEDEIECVLNESKSEEAVPVDLSKQVA